MTVEQLEVSLFLGRHVADVATNKKKKTPVDSQKSDHFRQLK